MAELPYQCHCHNFQAIQDETRDTAATENETPTGSGSESGGGGDNGVGGGFRAASVVESTSDGGFLAAGFPSAAQQAYPAHC